MSFVYTGMSNKITSTSAEPTASHAVSLRGVDFASEVDHWFVAQILPLEPMLMRLLRRYWKQPNDLPDFRQEIYVRVYETAQREGPPKDAGEYLYTCARNLLIDRARHAQVVSIDTFAELEEADHPVDPFSPERVVGARGELRLLEAALNELPPRCREVVSLRKIDGLSQRDIAERMGISEGTVEKQITLGIRALAESLLSQGVELAIQAKQWGRRHPRREENDA